VSSWGYVKRAAALIQSESFLFSLALLCLGIYNLLSLFIPRLQGVILDAVVNDKQSRFNSNILLFLYVSIAAGFFGGLQSLFFNVVGRRLAKTVRCQLFRGIVIQVHSTMNRRSAAPSTPHRTSPSSMGTAAAS
jgi:ABC-type multidrug transport system fused ATPase/permease subunit